MSKAEPRAGWIGLGKMGGAMVRHIADVPGGLVVSDPVVDHLSPLLAAGATRAANLCDLACCDIVFATIPNDAVLREVALGAEGLAARLKAGATFVEMSTVSPRCSREVAEAFERAGVHYLRAPISGSTAMAEAASLTILASGPRTGWDVARPFLERMSQRQFYLGEGDEARYMKLVLNALVGATSSITAEALALGGSGGLDRAAMMDVIGASAVASPLLQYKRNAIVAEDYKPAFSVTQMIKDFSLISDAGRETGVPLFVTNLVLEQYRAASNQGYADQDFFSLIPWISGQSAKLG